MDLYSESADITMMYLESNNISQHPDLQMELDISVYDKDNIFLFHDQPFREELSWIEYDKNSGRIDFIMQDGDLRNFGIPVSRAVGDYLQNNHIICVVLREGEQALSDVTLPLVTHH